jgi:putative salt-induced outer membrane protein YdiY
LEFGYSRQSGVTTQQNVSLRGQLDGKSGPDTFRGTAQLLESEVAGVTQADRLDADFRWRHELSKQVFVQSLTTGFTDALRGIDFSLEEQLGAGWKILAAKQQTADLGLGVAVRRQDQSVAGGTTGLLGTVFQDFAHTWTGGLRFSQESSLALATDQPLAAAPSPLGSTPVPAAGGNYRVRFNAALNGKMPGHTTYTVRYDYNFDRSVFDPNLRSDQRLTTSLGYVW